MLMMAPGLPTPAVREESEVPVVWVGRPVEGFEELKGWEQEQDSDLVLEQGHLTETLTVMGSGLGMTMGG